MKQQKQSSYKKGKRIPIRQPQVFSFFSVFFSNKLKKSIKGGIYKEQEGIKEKDDSRRVSLRLRAGEGVTHADEAPDAGPEAVVGKLAPTAGMGYGSVVEDAAEEVD